jgi:hypothetical protein
VFTACGIMHPRCCRPGILEAEELVGSRVTGSGVPRNFVREGGGSTNSVEDRENGDLGAVAP